MAERRRLDPTHAPPAAPQRGAASQTALPSSPHSTARGRHNPAAPAVHPCGGRRRGAGAAHPAPPRPAVTCSAAGAPAPFSAVALRRVPAGRGRLVRGLGGVGASRPARRAPLVDRAAVGGARLSRDALAGRAGGRRGRCRGHREGEEGERRKEGRARPG